MVYGLGCMQIVIRTTAPLLVMRSTDQALGVGFRVQGVRFRIDVQEVEVGCSVWSVN